MSSNSFSESVSHNLKSKFETFCIINAWVQWKKYAVENWQKHIEIAFKQIFLLKKFFLG